MYSIQSRRRPTRDVDRPRLYSQPHDSKACLSGANCRRRGSGIFPLHLVHPIVSLIHNLAGREPGKSSQTTQSRIIIIITITARSKEFQATVTTCRAREYAVLVLVLVQYPPRTPRIPTPEQAPVRRSHRPSMMRIMRCSACRLRTIAVE